MVYRDKEKQAAYQHEWYIANLMKIKAKHADPEYKIKKKLLAQTPERKAQNAKYDADPINKARATAYNIRPEVIARRQLREKSPENKVRRAKYNTDPINQIRVKLLEQRPEAKAKRAIYERERYASDTAYKLTKLLRARLCKAIKRKSKKSSAVKLLGCSIDELIIHLESQFTVGMSWTNHGQWHIDHILPVSSFNLEDPTQLTIVCHYTNLQPLWAKDNISKGGARLV